MKKILRLFTLALAVTLVISCDKESATDNEVDLKTAYVLSSSLPTSTGGTTPVILAVDKPRGGNVSCTDVSQAFNVTFDLCGDKLDFGDYDYDGDMEFKGSFPEWLEVTVTDNKYVAFTVKNTALSCFRVGAVIVKGSNSANVYYYEGGSLGDSGLASPINSSGSPAGLSNLTFCFYECELPPVVIAVKSWYYSSEGAYTWASSSGTSAFPSSAEWCRWLGYNLYPSTSSFDMNAAYSNTKVGEVTVNSNGDITITMNGMTIDVSYVYVGTLEGLQVPINGCPNYTVAPWVSNTIDGTSQTFTF